MEVTLSAGRRRPLVLIIFIPKPDLSVSHGFGASRKGRVNTDFFPLIKQWNESKSFLVHGQGDYVYIKSEGQQAVVEITERQRLRTQRVQPRRGRATVSRTIPDLKHVLQHGYSTRKGRGIDVKKGSVTIDCDSTQPPRTKLATRTPFDER
ncbi:hypothetical protein Vi05172_g11832 [Venturia inaequalis]|nr:hypothetical protein Vi05172_g11832 [Venturia inaequalis]